MAKLTLVNVWDKSIKYEGRGDLLVESTSGMTDYEEVEQEDGLFSVRLSLVCVYLQSLTEVPAFS